MRIVVDANPLYPLSPTLGPTGVGRWTAGAIRALAAAAPNWNIELVAFHLRGDADLDVSWMAPNVSFRRIPFSNRVYRKLRAVNALPPLEWFLGPVDAMIGSAYITWRGMHLAEIPVVYDLSFIRYPASVSRRNLYYLRWLLPRVLKRAAQVITISHAMKDEIAEHYEFDPNRIAVVPPGYDGSQLRERRTEGRESPQGLPDRYLLFVGTLEPRKNLRGLLEAYTRLKARRTDLPPLVVVGGMGWRTQELKSLLAANSVTDGVQVLGYVDDQELPSIYNGATVLIFPSFYEGFGLPVLEAMVHGCPVIASARGAIPEVAGDAALLIDPSDPADLERAIATILNDGVLRSQLISRGRERALLYSWQRSGEALRQAVERAVQTKRRVRA